MKPYEITCRYGNTGSNTSTLFVYPTRQGCWYVCDGSVNVNFVPLDELEDGVWIEELEDTDCFTWKAPIESLDDLIEAVEF